MRRELRELISLARRQGDPPGARACPAASPRRIDAGGSARSSRRSPTEAVEFAQFTLQVFDDVVLEEHRLRGPHPLRRLHPPDLLHGPGGREEPGQLLRRRDARGRPRGQGVRQVRRPATTSTTSPSTSSRGATSSSRYLKKVGWKGFVDGADSGVYRVAPLARLNAADGMATPAGPGGLREILRDPRRQARPPHAGQPLGAPRRDALRRRAHRRAGRATRRSPTPTSARIPPRRRPRASAWSRRRAARSSTTTRPTSAASSRRRT